MTLSEKHLNLSKTQLLEKAYELGVMYEKYSGGCSQCTAAALRELLGFEDLVVRIAASSCGGHAGLSVGTCGAVVGGTIVLDYYFGRSPAGVSAISEVPGTRDELHSGMETARILCEKFVRQYGSILCPQIQTRVFGRSFNLQDEADWDAFEAAGAHSDPSKCMSVVGNAVRWTLETLIEKQALQLDRYQPAHQ
jgi:C_GCAxxG_C_C family probable redox protein